MNVTIAQLLNQCRTESQYSALQMDAQWLLAHALHWPMARLYTYPDYALSATEHQHFNALWQRRQKGEPVAYIVGQQGFWTLTLTVNADTLIPRPETELLVETALELAGVEPINVADLGTGSGAIACALASERPQWRIIATDASTEALAVAKANVMRHGFAHIQLRQGNWFTPLAEERCTLILSNPPYISANDPHLQQGDVRFEPNHALVSGAHGLDALQWLVQQGRDHLNPKGYLLLEHGYDQGEAMRALFQTAGYHSITTRQDLNGQERLTYGQWLADDEYPLL